MVLKTSYDISSLFRRDYALNYIVTQNHLQMIHSAIFVFALEKFFLWLTVPRKTILACSIYAMRNPAVVKCRRSTISTYTTRLKLITLCYQTHASNKYPFLIPYPLSFLLSQQHWGWLNILPAAVCSRSRHHQKLGPPRPESAWFRAIRSGGALAPVGRQSLSIGREIDQVWLCETCTAEVCRVPTDGSACGRGSAADTTADMTMDPRSNQTNFTDPAQLNTEVIILAEHTTETSISFDAIYTVEMRTLFWLWPWTLTADLEKLSSSAHSHDEYLLQVSLKSTHYVMRNRMLMERRTDGQRWDDRTNDQNTQCIRIVLL